MYFLPIINSRPFNHPPFITLVLKRIENDRVDSLLKTRVIDRKILDRRIATVCVLSLVEQLILINHKYQTTTKCQHSLFRARYNYSRI